MAWCCKLCTVCFSNRAHLFKHYRLQHSHFSRVSPLPCLYKDCICTFHTLNALATHLSRYHNSEQTRTDRKNHKLVDFKCYLCPFQQAFSETAVFSHIRMHLKKHETVKCPYKDCDYNSNVYSSFNSHKSRVHNTGLSSDCCDNIIEVHGESLESASFEPTVDLNVECQGHMLEAECDDLCDSVTLRNQIKVNVATLFLKLQSILHVSNTAIQEIVEGLNQVFYLSQPLIREAVETTLIKCGHNASNSTISDVVSAVMDSNVVLSETTKGSKLSTNKRRKRFFEKNYPFVKPVEYSLGDGCTIYVPVLQTIQELFKNTDILSNLTVKNSGKGHYSSYRDSSHFNENDLLCTDDLTLAVQLYVDDLEIANPLGTSRKLYKLFTVYWVLSNLPPKFRSAMHTIQLALLAKVTDLQKCGYAAILAPLVRDLQVLEQDGVFIESVGRNVKGAVFCVCADNLAAHGLGGFVESFRRDYVCRFCLGTSEQFQVNEVRDEVFILREKESHDILVENVLKSETSTIKFGVKGICVLSESLKFFHPISGFPPDLLHDLLEGIVPVELSLCIKKMVLLKHFSLDYLNQRIASFQYQHTDKVDKPKPIPKSFSTRTTVGGNGHENATLLRFLPLLIGSKVPEGDAAWTVLMELKDVVELALCPSFTDGLLDYFDIKISDHRQALQQAFPDFRLRPKHHYLEHYPALIKRFGPLVHLWTMRFEAKHSFFKRAVRDSQNFKNVLKTLANKHQYMMAYHISSGSYFKPEMQASRVDSVPVSALPEVAQGHVKEQTNSDTIYHTSKITIDGTDYVTGMFVSVEKYGGLPMFSEIKDIYLLNNNITFLCCNYASWFEEHLRSFELMSRQDLSVYSQADFNDITPLSAYKIEGRLLLTPKRYIPVND